MFACRQLHPLCLSPCTCSQRCKQRAGRPERGRPAGQGRWPAEGRSREAEGPPDPLSLQKTKATIQVSLKSSILASTNIRNEPYIPSETADLDLGAAHTWGPGHVLKVCDTSTSSHYGASGSRGARFATVRVSAAQGPGVPVPTAPDSGWAVFQPLWGLRKHS